MSTNAFRIFDLEPRTAQEVTECETPNGIRQRLMRCSYENPLVRAVYCAADAAGLSGEDRMTVLAFEALRRLEIAEDRILEQARMTIAPSSIKKP